MSTRSLIGLKENGKFRYIYCHFDGYPEGVGKTLKAYYQDIHKIKQLLKLGDLSILGKDIGEKQDFNDKSTKNDDWCLAYGRDRQEAQKDVKAKFTRKHPLILFKNNSWIAYIYVFENGSWSYYHSSDLKRELLKAV